MVSIEILYLPFLYLYSIQIYYTLIMGQLDMSTKELVYTYYWDDFHTNRNAERRSVIKGRTVIELGTRTATSFVGNLYRVFDSSVKSFKYLLLVGVANQNEDYAFTTRQILCEDEVEGVTEAAALNALINPSITLVVDEIFSDDAFMDLCIVMKEIFPVKFIKTDEEKGLITSL